ncbi:MAG TPA: AAA domain-containing protein [Puia sp.]
MQLAYGKGVLLKTNHMETNHIRFTAFLPTAFDRGDYTTDDVIAFVLPLFRKVLGFHEAGQVAPFEKEEALFVPGLSLDIDESLVHAPTTALYRVKALFSLAEQRSFEVVETIKTRMETGDPVYLAGYRCFEQELGQHDPQTDIFCLGLILGSMSLGLNLYRPEDLEQFIRVRANPSRHRTALHPTIGGLITEMTELDRSRRTQDLYEVIRRLEHYREYDPERQTDLGQIAGWVHTELKDRDGFILDRLRNRLFDTSRRNRLLYYKPNSRFVNLTVGSVPIVLHYQSIRPELLFTWNDELGEQIRGMKEIVLNKYLRLEDHGYLPASLDKVRVESQRAIQEYGFSQLKLVIAFLSWHNLKEDPSERIQSPLLLLPVTLKKNKRLKEDHYVMKVLDNAAEVNPVLAGQLKDLYGIRLPDFIDLEEISPERFFRQVKAQIDKANQGIALRYIGKPRIRLIHHEARQTVNNYTRRTNRRTGVSLTLYVPDPKCYVPVELERWRRERMGAAEAGVSEKKTEGGEPINIGGPEADWKPAQAGGDSFELAASDNNPYHWDFDMCHMVLGNFNYKKMSLVRDYNRVIDEQLQHHVFDALFSDQPRVFAEHPFDLNRPDDWFHVITADPTQTRAILQSRAGYSYIIQGPPGTGKSQTITNLIADFVARGKNILFVCEKRAALDVVYHRLKQVGLEELCCYIHDSQGDKREFIKNLSATYAAFTRPDKDLATIRDHRQALLNKMKGPLEIFGEFHTTGQSKENNGNKERGTGVEIRQLIERIIVLREQLVPLTALQEEDLPSYEEWIAAQPIVALLEEALQEKGAEPVFADHPFSRIRESIFLSENPHRVLENALLPALRLLEEVEEGVRRSGVVLEDDRSRNTARLETEEAFQQLKSLVQFAVLLYPLARAGRPGLADPDTEEAKQLEREMYQYRRLQEAHQLALQKNTYWKDKLSEQDLANALSLAIRNEGSLRGFLNGSWQKLKKRLHQQYDLSAHSVAPTWRSILELLQAEYIAAEAVVQKRRQLQEAYGLENIDTAWLGIEVLQGKKGQVELTYLLQHPDSTRLTGDLQALHQPLSRLETQLRQCLQEPATGSLSSIRDELRNIQLNAEELGDLLPALRAFTELPEDVKTSLRHHALRPLQLEAVIARKALFGCYQAHRAFAAIDRQTLERAVQQLGEGYTALQQSNAEYIRAFIRQRFLQQIDLANMAASQLNEEQKKFKKLYNEGRKILENEFGKSMRHKSIRELSEKESGRVLKDLKPVWLMSPYSVSDSLPLDYDHFDVVIFDEASQITLEEGVPALYRSRQTIIVGDEKQMPPTDFFRAGAKDHDPDDLEKMEEGEGEWLSDDADSLLAQGARKLNSVLLSWHYRSHYETLISFSNHAFYEGKLLTIPDRTIHHREKTPIVVTRPDEAAGQAGALFDRSISFHFQSGSVYEKRSNAAEAGYIANMVRELLRRGASESIGIVAFSQEQQQAIETALETLAGSDPVFAQQLEEAYNRMENDQFTGLIVKNLENIQGDERDIVIMSVCYGFDARGKMLMNFGPINKRGGEKRLNVLFSRARRHMAIVSSIRHEHITNEYNEGASYLRRFLHYAEMISLGRMETARAILDSLTLPVAGRGASVTPAIICRQIGEQIRAMGYETAEQIGQSDFKCSLAVKKRPEDDHYSLGILIDDGQHYANKNLIEQYYQRPAILRAFGWKILPVFAKDWLHQPQKVMEQIAKMLQEPGEVTTGAGESAGGRVGAAAMMTEPERVDATGSMGTKAGTSYDHLAFRRLTSGDAGVDKFWEAATDGNTLVTRWGKTGARGQIQLKTFPGEEAARKEMERLVGERLKNGYRPDQDPR